MRALIDTNILVYRFDARFPQKQQICERILRRGIADQSIYIPHQAIIEFVAAVTRRRGDSRPLLEQRDAWREAEELITQFDVLYPTEAVLRQAIRGAATYQLSWFDANIWASAEHFGLGTLVTEDFEHNRLYGSVRVVNPFITPG